MAIPHETKELIFIDIKYKYFKNLCSLKDIALKYSVSQQTVSTCVSVVMTKMKEEIKNLKKETEELKTNSEEEISKYGIPESDKLKNLLNNKTHG